MSYLNYLCNNQGLNKREKIIGTCYTMCPQDEIWLRKREKLIHILEVVGDNFKLVKSYSRSAADANIAVPSLLRPYSVLKKTVNYLLHEVGKQTNVPVIVIYDFLNDRLRAVRQDMTIQRLLPEQCMELLEPIIRFHVYFAYRLCEKAINEFDPVLNNKLLLECVKWFLSCADEMDRLNRCFNTHKTALSLDLLNLEDSKTMCDRVLVECLYILCNIENYQPLVRYLGLPSYIKRNSLQIMSSAYNSKQLTVPTTILQDWMLFNSVVDVTECCKHYGLNVDNGVQFNKLSFKCDIEAHKPKLNNRLTGGQIINLHEVLTY
ncbi:germinal-center associated nuclear protein isoform X2 [Pieris brassicae]|uniref:germinal-center associated nuclear protein isoform X2 n=1 Tax=Pieris brassicae TaxID=7116 RepID=UPI001E6628ED|nr:germinal-center associated nuclear protein isoform X2 [Pieris brassicae]